MTQRLRMTSFSVAVLLSSLHVPVVASAELPEVVATRSVEIISEGTRLAGDLFWPSDWQEGQKLPAIVVFEGWGGVKEHAKKTRAPRFAAAGYFVLTFDFRGWGESDGRLVAVGEIPEPGPDGTVTVQAREIRDLVSPVERIADIRAAISWLELEPGVDRNRIGLWGTSFGGGNAVSVAAVDRRVRCVVSQVGTLNPRQNWVDAMKGLLSGYSKTEGSPAELEAEYDRVVHGMAQRAGRVERLLDEQRITLGFDGLLAVAEGAREDQDVVALVKDENADLGRFFSILANFPERADEIYLVHRAFRARGLVGPFPQGIGYGTLPPMSGIADLTQHIQYAPIEEADRVSCPVLMIDVSEEEYGDPANSTALLATRLEARGVPVRREVFEGVSHFEIYRSPALERALKLAIEWYDEHLKAQPQAVEGAVAAAP
jgi:dienelactone hydrolase